MVLWVSPSIAVIRTKLLRTSGIQTLIQTIVLDVFKRFMVAKKYLRRENES